MEVDRFKFSAQVSGYVPKPIKARMQALRSVDPKRFSESRIVEDGIMKVLAAFEAEAASFSGPTQGAPGKRKRGTA